MNLCAILLVALNCHSIILAASAITVQPLWNVSVNRTHTCHIGERNTSGSDIIFRGDAYESCSIQVNASHGSPTSIEIPANDIDEQFDIFVERIGHLMNCTNRYVVVKTQDRSCRSVFIHDSIRFNLKGNVSLLISSIELSDFHTLLCPESNHPVISGGGQIQNCQNVKGYKEQITCTLQNGYCRMPFSKHCNATLSQTVVIFHCLDNSLIQANDAMLSYPLGMYGLLLYGQNIIKLEAKSFYRLNTLQYLALDRNHLSRLDGYVFLGMYSLKTLLLYGNQLFQLDALTFQGLRSLTRLDLDDNRLITLPVDLFSQLHNLKKLYLFGNQLTSLPDNIFHLLGTLSRVELHNNELIVLPNGLFQGLTSLDRLILFGNQLSSLDADIFHGLNMVTMLDLNSNNLTELSVGVFNGLERLTHLWLNKNNLVTLDDNVFYNFSNVISLSLYGNRLSALPQTLFQSMVNLKYLYLYDNHLAEIDEYLFHGLSNMIILSLQDNELRQIPVNLFHNMGELIYLALFANKLKDLPTGCFQTLQSLSRLYLYTNQITSLDKDIFKGLGNLQYLSVNHNELVTLPLGLFSGLDNLIQLFLNNNKLSSLSPGILSPLKNLTILSLKENSLVRLADGVFSGLHNLEFLFLYSNQLESLGANLFEELYSLHEIFLNTNALKHLDKNTFKGAVNITLIDLSNNTLTECPIIKHLPRLSFLNIRNNTLTGITHDSFSSLSENAELFVSQHEICECYAPTRVICSAASDRSPYLTCDRLLSDRVLVVIMWLIGINALFGNMYVLVWRKMNVQKNKVQYLLLSNLAISDALMGIYMVIIAVADIYFGDYFPLQSENWRSGITCRIAGALSIASSEASVLFITLISIDRFICIKYPYSVNKMGKMSTIMSSVLIWIFSLTLGIIPSVFSGRNFKFYDNSHVCIGLPLSLTSKFSITKSSTSIRPEDTKLRYEKETFTTQFMGVANGLYFSTAIFLGLNCICYLIILTCYIEIVRSVMKSSKQVGRTREMKEQIALTTKVSAIVATDFLCWFPIIVLGILVQTRIVVLPPSVYAWCVTFVLPINSAINPYLYTIAEIISNYRKRKSEKNNSKLTDMAMQSRNTE